MIVNQLWNDTETGKPFQAQSRCSTVTGQAHLDDICTKTSLTQSSDERNQYYMMQDDIDATIVFTLQNSTTLNIISATLTGPESR